MNIKFDLLTIYWCALSSSGIVQPTLESCSYVQLRKLYMIPSELLLRKIKKQQKMHKALNIKFLLFRDFVIWILITVAHDHYGHGQLCLVMAGCAQSKVAMASEKWPQQEKVKFYDKKTFEK